MKKSYSHDSLADRKCKDCGKQLKNNLLQKHPDAEFCYKHWVKRNGMESRRESYQK